MVDFNNETTVATPSKDVMRIYLLEKKANTEEALAWYMEKHFNNIDCDISKVRTKLLVWYLQLEPMINRHWKVEIEGIAIDRILNIIETGPIQGLKELIIKFNKLLDIVMITRLDTKERGANTWEAANIQFGH